MKDKTEEIMRALTNPTCERCNITFTKMEYMDTHMKTKHDESDDMRIYRLTQAVEAVEKKEKASKRIVSNDCTECGLVFVSNLEQIIHIENYHSVKKGEKRSPCTRVEYVKKK